jgi:hypothetical protein
MLSTALRLYAELTAAREALTDANLCALTAANEGDPASARSHRARANGLRTKVGKAASAFRTARDNAVFYDGHEAATILAGLE